MFQDWNIFVSDHAFEAGLLWLERQVALRQAQWRGFFTYTDLAATCDAALVAAIAKEAILGLGAILALLTSTVVLLLAHSVAKTALPTDMADVTAPSLVNTVEITPSLSNTTAETQTYDGLYGFNNEQLPTSLECCDQWVKYHGSIESKRNWFDAIVLYDWKSFEPWWSKTSVMNWLYQSSLITPMQRWLEKINLYAEFFKQEDIDPRRAEQCESTGRGRLSDSRCVRQWLNLSKLGMFVASVSDR